MSATCPVCLCEQAEGLLCHDDTTRLERELGDVAAIVGELDITLSKQARIGVAGAPGLARERSPLNVGAMQAADNLGNVLTTWARDVCKKAPPRPGDCANKVTERLGSAITNPSAIAARLLLRHVPEIRRHPAVVELVDEISDAIHQARRAVDRPADRVYLGQCMVPTPDEEGRPVTCLEDIYASPTASHARCKVCGVTHAVVDRRKWLMDQAEDRLFTVKEAAQMLGHIGGMAVTEHSIRGYIRRPSNPLAYRVGTNLIRLGDLLDLVRKDGQRKSA